MNNITKIGIVPGAINEYVLENGTTIAKALELAGLTAEGYDVRMDGVSVTDATVIPEGTLLIVLAKQIKGNAPMVKIGTVPGAINEYVLEPGTTVGTALTLANINAEGFDFRLDGVLVTMTSVIAEGAQLLVGAKQIKGNSEQVILKVGIVPGAINEFVVEEGTTVGEVLTLAQLERAGYDVRLDGDLVEDADFIEEDSKLLVLAKQIKGNK